MLKRQRLPHAPKASLLGNELQNAQELGWLEQKVCYRGLVGPKVLRVCCPFPTGVFDGRLGLARDTVLHIAGR